MRSISVLGVVSFVIRCQSVRPRREGRDDGCHREDPALRVASVTQSVPFGGKDHSSAPAASQRAIWRARGETDAV